MAAVDAFGARESVELRHWRAHPATVSWPQLAVVALVALLLSTQIFFQAGIVESSDAGALVAGWLPYFGEALACGISIWLAVAAFEKAFELQGIWRAISTGIVIFAAAFVAECAFLGFAQPPGFFPPWTSIAGDALRWSLWGGIVLAAHWQALRHAQAAMFLAQERVERGRAEQRRTEADLQLLQAQIQPHFLFNLLAHVRRLYRVGEDQGLHAVERLRSYMKEVLGAFGHDETSISRELELVRAYLELTKIGLGERLSFVIDASPEVASVRIPPLAVLTLAENAVKHGIAPLARPGVVQVVARRDAGGVRIEVRDDGEAAALSAGTGVGLANTKARLRAMYGAAATLSLDAGPGRGAVAAIEITAP